ncbi:small secreted protein [Xylariales sp. AK1849]|nr:small secreted protein [Xylariales sp. AK1849]
MSHFQTHLTLLLLMAASFVRGVTNDKANEYKDSACTDASYTHTGQLVQVTMDDTSHSVYTATSADDYLKWQAFDGKTSDGGECSGDLLGDLGGPTKPCTDLDNYFPGQRIRCISLCAPDVDSDLPCYAES